MGSRNIPGSHFSEDYKIEATEYFMTESDHRNLSRLWQRTQRPPKYLPDPAHRINILEAMDSGEFDTHINELIW